ncbi:MAG TPA: metallophosphoesterase [Paracoccaceae bacterium]|nr:metallophosphoesterase [Paracoccaceae bacterium]
MRIAQITDSHLVGAGRLWKGQVDCATRLAEAVERVNALAPDLVVHTGDLAENGEAPEYEEAAAILAGLEAPLRILPGNHDRRAPLAAAFSGQGWEGAPFLNFRLEAEGLSVIGLDTVAEGLTEGRFGEVQADWLRRALEGASPVLLFAHHPPCPMDLPFMDQYVFDGTERAASLISGRRDLLRIVVGHVHAAAERHWAGTIVAACPALSVQIPPEQPLDASAGWVDAPGAIRLHDWRPETGLTVKLVSVAPGAPPRPFED